MHEKKALKGPIQGSKRDCIRYILKRSVCLQARHVIEKSVQKMVSLLAGSDAEAEGLLSERAELTAHDCYQAAVSHFRTHCFNWHSPTVSPDPWGPSPRPPSPVTAAPKAKLRLPPRNHMGYIAL